MIDRLPPHDTLYEALTRRDAELDGVVFVAVRTTRIFCRPVCPARTPLSKNITFYSSPQEAVEAGYRPCKRCRPLDAGGGAPPLLADLVARVDAEPSKRWSGGDLRAIGVDPATARRQFQRRFGMSFTQYVRSRRVRQAFAAIQEGMPVLDAQLESGFDSGSGFREAFVREFGNPPNKSREAKAFVLDWIDTPLGLMLAVAGEDELHMLEFVERKSLRGNLERYRAHFNAAILPGRSAALDSIRRDVASYFAGDSLEFSTPIARAGTPFQQAAWEELRRIPPGTTRSYSEIAARIGRPKAVRAVAAANANNRCAIILPCHRVIGADGTLTGYAAGLWRKQWLLDHERRVASHSTIAHGVATLAAQPG
jgi:AraC family transcriptional regulator, regulatory protein of adaptative response / methylated-DNA-[protein]-cysteine methyltransferase